MVENSTELTPSDEASHDGIPTITEDNKEKEEEKEENYPIPEEVLKKIPEKERKNFISEVTSFFAGQFRVPNPMMNKVTSQHISDILKYSDEEDKRDREDYKRDRNLKLFIFLGVLLFIVFLVIIFKDNVNTLISILGAMAALAGAAFGGWGFGKRSD